MQMNKTLIVAGTILCSSSAVAETWSTGDCITQKGTKIYYALSQGKGLIIYDDGKPEPIFSKRPSENIGVIVHIGKAGNMTLAVDLTTGRGYAITKFDDGKTVEENVSCHLSSIQK